MRRLAVIVFIMAILGFALYARVLKSPFQFDDTINIVDNIDIRNPSNIEIIFLKWPTRFTAFMTFAVNYSLGKLNVVGYHVVNILILIGCAVLAYIFVTLLLSAPKMAKKTVSRYSREIGFFTAMIFLCHPIQTESVSYIFQRTESLMGFFYLLTMCLYMKMRLMKERGGAKIKWRKYYYYTWMSAVLCVLSKENGVTLPAMLIVLECMCFDHGPYSFFKIGVPTHRDLKRVFKFLFLIPLMITLLFITKPATYADIHVFMTDEMSSKTYLLTQFRVIMTYIRLLAAPINQNLDYDYPRVNSVLEAPFILSFLALAMILIIAFRMRRKHTAVSFFIFWFFITLMPESSFIPLADVIFEHRLFVPSLGYAFTLSYFAYCILENRWKYSGRVFLSAAVVIYSALTFQRNGVWRDPIRLWDDVVRKSPLKDRGYFGRGNSYAEENKFKRALEDYAKARQLGLRLSPDLYCNTGNIYSKLDLLDKAIKSYDMAIAVDSEYMKAYNNRGNIYFRKGLPYKAIEDISYSIKLHYKRAIPYYNRANIYMSLKKYDQALKDYTRAIVFEPDNSNYYLNRGICYARNKEFDNALADFSAAVNLNPRNVKAYYNRGCAYMARGNYILASEDISKAVEIDPTFDENMRSVSVASYCSEESKIEK